MRCPDCNSDNASYVGVDDGFFGDAVCDIWLCQDCGLEFEGHCVGFDVSWEQQAVDEIIAEENDDDDTREFPI